MMIQPKKRKEKRNWKIIFIFLFGLIFLFLVSNSFVRAYLRQGDINQEEENLKNDILVLENQNEELKKFLNYLDSDNFVEMQARLKLGLKKEGEEAYIIKDLSEKNSSTIESVRATGFGVDKKSKMDNLKSWWKYFFSES